MKNFVQTLAELNGGKLSEELTEALAELCKHCEATGKKGELKLTLKLRPAKGNHGAIHVEHEVAMKVPPFDRPVDYLFLTQSGELVREDPRQQQLPLRVVAVPEAGNVTLRQVNAAPPMAVHASTPPPPANAIPDPITGEFRAPLPVVPQAGAAA